MEKEAERIQASIRKHHELEEQQRKAVKQANLMLQRHQLQQIDFQHQLKEAEKAQIKQEIALNEVSTFVTVRLAIESITDK